MNYQINYFLLVLLLLSAAGCKDEPPVVPLPPIFKDTITVTITDVAHRSITVNVKTTINFPNSFIELYRQINNADTLVAEYPITTADTTIVDDNNGKNLQLNTEYTYYAVRRNETGEKKDSSNIVTAKTLNATSFNYIWQEFAIGEWNSTIYDVWGCAENNVYACGTIMINDSTAYGIIKWNGVEWLLEKEIGGLLSIYGFSSSDIWAVGSGAWHYNGSEWEEYTYTDSVITNNITYTSIWGTSSANLYFGNVGGKIVHWDGNKASVVYINESNVQVMDLDGYASDFIIGVGIGFTPPLLAVYFNGLDWNKLPIENDPSLYSVAIVSRNHIYFAGSGVYQMKGNSFSRIYTSGYFMYDIEYNRQNGVTVAAGPFDGVYINNGIEWREYRSQISSDNTAYHGIFLINNTIFCVGSTSSEAKIIIGRNN
jgi:hypothetical protein